mmetsp:Transcript_41460/g.104551  ORF Transcript_41460/g.104551 Transcript_41460/m.104551 type:complete len:307 (-) Transcript_41460:246-1166(-)
MVGEDRDTEFAWLEDFDNTTRQCSVRGQCKVALETHKAALLLGGYVDGVVAPAQHAVQRVATRIEKHLIGDSLRLPNLVTLLLVQADSEALQAEIAGELGADQARGTVEAAHHRRVEVRHHDLERLVVLTGGLLDTEVGRVQIPVVAGERAQHVGTAGVLEVAAQLRDLSTEGGVREDLLVWEHVVLATEDHKAESESEVARVLQQQRQSAEQGGGSAGLQNHLERVDKERTLRQNKRVHVGVAGCTHNGTACQSQHGRPLLLGHIAQSTGAIRVNTKVNLQLLLRALEGRVGGVTCTLHRDERTR